MRPHSILQGKHPFARTALLLLGSVLLLTAFYLGVVLNLPYNSDEATALLAAQSVVQGNVLLHGWTLDTAAWYTTELPPLVMGVLTLGLSWKVMYAATAVSLALVAVLIIHVSLDEGRQPMSAGRILVPAVLTFFLPGMVLGDGILSSAHLMGYAYSLVCVFCLRRIEQTGERYWQAVFAVFLALAIIGDLFAFYFMALPILVVCAVRLVLMGSDRTTLRVLAATVASLAFSALVLGLAALVGGAAVPGKPAGFVSVQELGRNAYLLLANSLALFSVGIPGKPIVGLGTLLDLIHLSGWLLLAFTIWVTVRHVRTLALATQITAAVVVFNLLENLFSTAPGPGAARYLAPALIFGILLMSRVVTDSTLVRNHPRLILAGCLILFLSLLPPLSFSKPVSPGDALARMLLRLGLENGYGPGRRSNNITVATAGQVTVRAVRLAGEGLLAPQQSLSDSDWYHSYANFLVINAQGQPGFDPTREQAISILGPPAEQYELYRYGYLLVWDHDITPFLSRP